MNNTEFTLTGATVFNHPKFGNLRVMTDGEGNPWFVGKVVAELLGYATPQKALADHIEIEDSKLLIYKAFSKTEQASDLWKGNDYSNKTLINESGLYSLILASKLPQARVFKHWVTAEVLPQIRKTGGYIPVTAQDDEQTILAKALLISQRTIKEKDNLIASQQQKLIEQKPKVRFADALTESDGAVMMSEMAKILTQNGFETGLRRFYNLLRKEGFIFKNKTEPMQEWVEKGLFRLKATLIETHHGAKESITPLVTGKGQKFFIERYCGVQ